MATPTAPPVLGRYECLVPLGRGGMAEVWVARVRGARGFEKLVAVKLMLPALLDDPGAEAMFLDEARLASRIRHPNVTEIFDLGEESRQLFIAMEWVDGDSVAALARAIGDTPMPLAVSVAIAMEAAKGLHAAHELKDDDGHPMGLVHRDVSPHNILLGRTGLVVLSDFGIAKAIGQSTHTDTGLVKGKPAYMAPEQALGAPLDRRADVFALGVIVYELTTGRHPFRGNNAVETANRLLHQPLVAPSLVARGHYPPELEALVLHALAREPAERFQSAEEFRMALSRLAREVVGECSTDDLAGFVQTHLGERLKARDAAIRDAMANPRPAPARAAVTAELTATALGDGRPASDTAPANAGPDAAARTGATEVSLARAVSPETHPRRRWLSGWLLASALVLGALAWLGATRLRPAQNDATRALPTAEVAKPTPSSVAAPFASSSSTATVSAGDAIPSAAGSSASAAQPRSAPAHVTSPRPRPTKAKASPDTAARIPVRNPGF